jgi:signal transduction histidine kinase
MIVRIKRKEIHTCAIDFSDIIDKVLQELEAVDGFTSIKFTINIDSPSVFVSDFHLLSVILFNLIHNSICYRDESQNMGSVKIEVRNEDKDHILLDIEDTGIGIEEEIKDEIFKMFYRGNSKSTGAGLGLYVVKSAVELLNGKIELIKTKIGTRFQLILPNMK